jgi:hypothetical protein
VSELDSSRELHQLTHQHQLSSVAWFTLFIECFTVVTTLQGLEWCSSRVCMRHSGLLRGAAQAATM